MLQSYYKKRVINFAVFVVSLMALAGGPVLMSTLSARALNQSTNFVVTIPDVPTLQITLYDDQGNEMDSEDITSMNVTATMATAGFNTKGMSVMVGTSSTAGYHLNMSVANGGQLVSGANSIPSLASETDAEDNPYTCSVATADICNFTENSWGYWMTGFGTNVYKPIPAAETELVNYTTGATDGETTHFSFGVRANAKQPAGNYTTTINYIATANPEPVDNISKVQTMQDFAMLSAEEYTAVLASMDPAETYTLADSRDDNSYTIQKLADGRVWMLDNLALGGSSAMTLDSTNTNLADNTAFTLPASGTVCFSTSNCTGTDGTTTGTGYTVAAINANYKTTTSANNIDFTYNSNGDVSKAGVYYNYCAASAGTICAAEGSNNDSAQYDICPKGWRLPTGGGSGEFQALTNNLVGETSSFSDATKYATFKAAFHAGLSGYFYNGSVQYQASYVGFWSSTRYDGNSMYRLFLDTSTVYPHNIDGRYYGSPVRCVLKSAAERKLESGMTMQSFASMSSEDKTTFLASVPTDAQYQLTDSRDGKTYYVAKLADGHVWMTQNLDLDLKGKDADGNDIVLTSENTDLTAYNTGAYTTANGYTQDPTTNVITWTPTNATIDASAVTNSSIPNWTDDYNIPYSVDPGNWYWNRDTYYASTTNNYLSNQAGDKFRKDTPYTYNGEHGHVGNYYNWSAAIATNNSTTYSSSTLSNTSNNPQNSICPAGWRLPTVYSSATSADARNEFYVLMTKYSAYVTSGSSRDTNLTAAPLYFVRGGRVNSSLLKDSGYIGNYWSSTVSGSGATYHLYFYSGNINPADSNSRGNGFSVRCLLR